MPVQHKFRPHHLALAIALTVGSTQVAIAQQPEVQDVIGVSVDEVVTEKKPTKPRNRAPKSDDKIPDLLAIKNFIGPKEYATAPATNVGQTVTPVLTTPLARPVIEFSEAFYEFLEFPEPTVAHAQLVETREHPLETFEDNYAPVHLSVSKPLQTLEGVSLQLGDADDLLIIEDGADWDGRLDGGKGKNALLLNASKGGNIGETANFAGMRVARGSWELSDEFHGHAEVSAGAALFNNASIKGDALVDSGGLYGGFGNVANLHVDGFLIANAELGSPIIKGDLTFGDTAIFSYEVSPDDITIPVLVRGTAKLGNARFVAHGTPGVYADSIVRPVLFAENIEGEFGEVLTNLAYMKPTLSYGEKEVVLTYERNATKLADLARTPGAQALARSVDTPKTTVQNDAVHALVNSTREAAPIALEQLAAGSNANLAKATLSSVTPVSASMLSAMRQLDSRSGAGHGAGNSPRRAAGGADSGRVWVQGLGHGGKVDRDFDSTLKHATQGLVMGADWRLNEQWHVGLLGGKTQTSLDARQYDGDLDSWHLGAYAVRQDGPLALRLGATYASHDGSSKRRVAFNSFSDRLKGNYNANTQQAFAELGFNLGRNNVTFEPFASLGYQRYQRDSYTEKGGDAALNVFGQTRDNLSTTLGFRAAKTGRLNNGMSLTPRFSAGWKHLYGELDGDTSQQLVKGGKRFAVTGAELDRNSLAVDAGLDLGLSANHTLGVGLTGEFGTESRTHGVMGQWRMAF